MKIRIGLVAIGLLALAGCTPADQQYCQSYGVTGAQYAKCMDYYHQQQSAFSTDRDVCELKADLTYPRSLYDTGHYEHVMGGFGYDGRYYGGQTIQVSPDYYHNQQVDRLRMRIIEPCMQAQGWNSGNSWQAGRHAATPVKKGGSKKLPWQK